MSTDGNNSNRTILNEGPLLRMALFCNEIIEGKDNVLSVIKIIDQVTFHVQNLEEFQSKGVAFSFKILLGFYSGGAAGEHKVCLRVTKPDPGKGIEGKDFVNIFELSAKPEGFISIALSAKFTFDQEGVWAFDVLLDERLMTRIFLPVRVTVKKKS